MNGAQWIQTIFEFAMAATIIWGIFNEDKLVALEDKLFRRKK